MSVKKIIAVAAVIPMLAFAGVGCGSDNETKTVTANPPSQTQPRVPTPPTQPTPAPAPVPNQQQRRAEAIVILKRIIADANRGKVAGKKIQTDANAGDTAAVCADVQEYDASDDALQKDVRKLNEYGDVVPADKLATLNRAAAKVHTVRLKLDQLASQNCGSTLS